MSTAGAGMAGVDVHVSAGVGVARVVAWMLKCNTHTPKKKEEEEKRNAGAEHYCCCTQQQKKLEQLQKKGADARVPKPVVPAEVTLIPSGAPADMIATWGHTCKFSPLNSLLNLFLG